MPGTTLETRPHESRRRAGLSGRREQMVCPGCARLGLATVALGVGALCIPATGAAGDLPQGVPSHDSVLVRTPHLPDPREEGRRAPRAMVVRDPADKRSIHGYFQVSEVYSPRMLDPNVRRLVQEGTGSLLQNPQAVPNLVDAINEFTDIDAEITSRHSFGSKELMEAPWVFVPRLRFILSEAEVPHVGRYLESGGFILADAGVAVGGQEDVFIREAIREALASVGRHARFGRLPATHPIYHSYFDFDSPPRAILGGSGAGAASAGMGRTNVDYIVGVKVDDRLAVAITYQNLGAVWENLPQRHEPSGFNDNSRHLQFGINTIVFALTQKGSITQKAMALTR